MTANRDDQIKMLFWQTMHQLGRVSGNIHPRFGHHLHCQRIKTMNLNPGRIGINPYRERGYFFQTKGRTIK